MTFLKTNQNLDMDLSKRNENWKKESSLNIHCYINLFFLSSSLNLQVQLSANHAQNIVAVNADKRKTFSDSFRCFDDLDKSSFYTFLKIFYPKINHSIV